MMHHYYGVIEARAHGMMHQLRSMMPGSRAIDLEICPAHQSAIYSCNVLYIGNHDEGNIFTQDLILQQSSTQVHAGLHSRLLGLRQFRNRSILVMFRIF